MVSAAAQKSNRGLTSGYLLRGSFLAAQQAWHLLNDAGILFGARRYASSLVLSVYSIEETGRSRIYLEDTDLTIQGQSTTLVELRKKCKAHDEKLGQGRSPLTISASICRQGVPPMLGSEQENELIRRLKEKRELAKKSAASETHKKRFEALYVDPLDGIGAWNVPSETSSYDAWDMLYIAGIEYRVNQENLTKRQASAEFQEIISRALPVLPECISLPDSY